MKKSIAASAFVLCVAMPVLAQTTVPQTTMPQTTIPTTSVTSVTSYPSVMSTAMFTSKIKGLTIYNQDNKSVGEIEDIAFGSNKSLDAYIVSVGGFLGMGEHYVAVSPSAVDIRWDASAKKWMAKMNATVDQVKAAPEFKYPTY